MALFSIMLKTGPFTYQGSDTVYHFVKAAAAKGHQVQLFLFLDGVFNATKEMNPADERNISKMMVELSELDGVDVFACAVCSKFRGVTEDMLVEEVTMGSSILDMGELLWQDDVIMLNFGM